MGSGEHAVCSRQTGVVAFNYFKSEAIVPRFKIWYHAAIYPHALPKFHPSGHTLPNSVILCFFYNMERSFIVLRINNGSAITSHCCPSVSVGQRWSRPRKRVCAFGQNRSRQAADQVHSWTLALGGQAENLFP